MIMWLWRHARCLLWSGHKWGPVTSSQVLRFMQNRYGMDARAMYRTGYVECAKCHDIKFHRC